MVSIVVPLWNGERALPATLAALAAIADPHYEVIFVDDGSNDGSADLVRTSGFTLVQLTRNHGAGTARNVGAHVAQGEILAFTDADCIVPTTWLAGIRRDLAEESLLGVSGPYSGAHERSKAAMFALSMLSIMERSHPTLTRSCTSSNLACRRDDFWSTGGFPIFGLGTSPSHPYQGHEDGNWAHTATASTGRSILWQPANAVVHQFRSSLLSFLKEQRFIAEVLAVSLCRYPTMLANRSNVHKGRSLVKVGTLALALVLVVPAAVIMNAQRGAPRFVAGALAICTIGLLAAAAMILPLLRQAWRQERSVFFLAYASAAVVLTSLAWLLGGLQGILKVARHGARFTNIPDLPPHVVDRSEVA